MLENTLRRKLTQLEEKGLCRQLSLSTGVDFSSNDILGLSHHPHIRETLIEALQRGVPMGSGGSRLLCGHHLQHEKVEKFLAHKFQRPSALVYGSGYLANVGVITSLFSNTHIFSNVHIFSDELNHASLIDGIRLSGASKSIYKHCDLRDLEEKMSQIEGHPSPQSPMEKAPFIEKAPLEPPPFKVIISESLFSMEGDFAPLQDLYALAQKHEAWLFIDEAHATGIYGQKGLGFVDDLESKRNIISVHTMGKAFGSQGAFVLCSEEVKKWLINTSRSFIYTTAPSPLVMEQWMAAWTVWESEPQLRQKLWEHMDWLWTHLGKNHSYAHSDGRGTQRSHIVSVLVPGSRQVTRVAEGLQRKNFNIKPIRYPTVAKGNERLRICLKSTQTRQQLEEVFHFIKET